MAAASKGSGHRNPFSKRRYCEFCRRTVRFLCGYDNESGLWLFECHDSGQLHELYPERQMHCPSCKGVRPFITRARLQTSPLQYVCTSCGDMFPRNGKAPAAPPPAFAPARA